MKNPKILVLDGDTSLAVQVREVSGGLRPRPDVETCQKVASVGDLLTERGPFDLLVAGSSLATRAGMSRLEIIHDELPAMSLMLAFADRPDANLRDIVRTGAMDLVQLPAVDAALRDSVERGLSLARQRTAVAAEAAAPAAPAVHNGTVFTVASATGGCGKTFYATNLAYFLHQRTGKRTCVVDLDLQFGEVSTALRLRPKYTIFDALQRDESDDSDLQAHVEEYLVTHESGVHVLAAPKDPSDADRISPPDVTRIIEAIRTRFDYVIVDTPAALTEIVLAAFDLSDALYVLATLDLPSVRNMSVFLSTLEKLKISADNVKLILNKAERDVGIDVEQVTKLFAQGFSSVLPYAREVSKSVNVGTPILAFSPNSEVSRLMLAGMMPLLPEDSRDNTKKDHHAVKGERRSLVSRLFRPVARPRPVGS